ncbi:MAG: autotransporter-associated beta strand repeat-containing protein [Dysgonamonadaceae bacterium]|nr:autotransporter-associated beta strand repeat-containing protein [Dysgonamonadaceae bacterium]
MENLDRGLVAVEVVNGVYIQWRIPASEWYGTTYHLYRDGAKITSSPISGASNYTDTDGTPASHYQVAAVIDGTEQTPCASVSVLPNPYIELTLQPIPKIDGVPDSYYADYITNDIVTADLDGDGAYDFIVKRMNDGYDSANPYENKYYTLFDAYRSDGTFLWRIDVGPNLFHNVEINAMVYDFDGDGKAEVVMRTSEGTIDGEGNLIPDLGNAMGEPVPDGKTNYRDRLQNNGQWFEYEGPEYLSLFDGETGRMIDRIDHIARQPVSQWGTSGTQAGGLAHRACKYHYGAPYLDGKRPSLFVSRGIYYRTKMVAYDIIDRKFVKRWEWDSGTGAYCGQGNHNFSVADVDNDGRDEIVYGSMTIDDDGTGLYSTGLGHGDAIHAGDFDPYRKGLEVFACLENSPYHGTTFRTAENGNILLQYIAGSDCGRAMAANFSAQYKGAELWPSTGGSFSASERREILNFYGKSTNYRIYWDGDLLEELVDHNGFSSSSGKGTGAVQKYTGSSWKDLLVTTGYYSCNYTKGTPCLQADLFGDWREELIYKSDDESKIRIYFTTIPTEHRIYTLMHDLQYRQAIAWQMCGYNQPPHVSYFLGEAEGITLPPPPVADNGRLVFESSAGWNTTSSNWKKDGAVRTYQDGEDVLFDVSGQTAEAISLNTSVAPRNLFVNAPGDYTFDMTNGKLTGNMRLLKQGAGKLIFNGNHDYSGATELWDGVTVFNGELTNSPVWINRFAELETTGVLGKTLTLEYGACLYPGGKNTTGNLTIAGGLTLNEKAVVMFDLGASAGECDRISLANQTFTPTNSAVFRIINQGTVEEGDYVLMQDVAAIDGNIDGVAVEGLPDKFATLSFSDGTVILTVANMRNSASILWKGDNNNPVWETGGAANFSLNGTNTYFAVGDDVTFDDSAPSKTVNKSGLLPAGDITVDTENNYIIQGEGVISGAASLTKTGSGKLTLKGVNEYTGATIVAGGTLSVEKMPTLEYAGSIGFGSNNPELFVLDGGTLTSAVATGTLTSSKAIQAGANGGTFHTNINFEWNALITGGVLTKTGNGSLSLFAANSLDRLVIQSGTVNLKTEEATPGKTVVFESGVLNCLNNSSSYSAAAWNIEVPEGKSGTINLDSRCTYSGKLTGGGNLTVQSPFVRSDLNGNWSEFTGVITATSDSDGGDLRFNNNYGLPNAELNVAGKLNVYNNTGNAFAIGALSGTTDATLSGNHLWTIGAKNTNSVFNGKITAGSLTKTGTGALTLSNVNTYTGTTAVNNGRLIVTASGGSGTGTGNVTVNNNGSIGGTGIVGGNVSVAGGGFVEPGNEAASSWTGRLGTLRLEKNLTLNGTLRMGVRNAPGYSADKLLVNGNLALNGHLLVEIINGGESFPLGAELTLLDVAGTISGQFLSLTLPPVDAGTVWDTNSLLTTGKIKVVPATGIHSPEAKSTLILCPNPAQESVAIDWPAEEIFRVEIIDLSGKTVLYETGFVSGKSVNISGLSQGLYVVRCHALSGILEKVLLVTRK